MSNSSLISYTKISPNKYVSRKHSIDTITIHCYVGQVTVEDAANWFSKASTQASCNYMIGTDGKIALIVEEKDHSWCSSNYDNDDRAITIECASDKVHPYAINNQVYASLINLCVDICNRNGIKELKWKGDKSLIGQVDKQNMTVHRWFKNKACPGDYIYNRLGQIASEVNSRINLNNGSSSVNSNYPTVPFEVKVIIDDLNYRSAPSMSGKVMGQTKKGTFTIIDVIDGWGKLKSGAGWIWLGNPSYCTIVNGSTSSSNPNTDTNIPFMVQVSIPDLYIRKGPGTNYETSGFTGIGSFTITEVKSGPGSNSGWGKLKSGAGWISLDYAKRF